MTPRAANGKLSVGWWLVAEGDCPLPVRDMVNLIDFDWKPSDADFANARKLANEMPWLAGGHPWTP